MCSKRKTTPVHWIFHIHSKRPRTYRHVACIPSVPVLQIADAGEYSAVFRTIQLESQIPAFICETAKRASANSEAGPSPVRFQVRVVPGMRLTFSLIHNSNGITNRGMFTSYGNCIVKVKRLGGSHRRSISLPANEHRGDRIALDYKRPLPCLVIMTAIFPASTSLTSLADPKFACSEFECDEQKQWLRLTAQRNISGTTYKIRWASLNWFQLI